MKFEVERRALVDDSRLPKIIGYLDANGKEVKRHKRFSICYVKNQDITADPDNPIDLRVRITNGRAELSLKYGDWHSASAREEYGLPFDIANIETLLKMNFRIGFKWGILAYTERRDFVVNDLLVSIDDHADYPRTLIEIEKVCDAKNDIPLAESEIGKLFETLGLKILDSVALRKVYEEVNAREKWRFDFTKEDIGDFVKDWEEYIKCKK